MSPRRHVAPQQVWLVDFGQPIGHEQGGLRPAVIIGSAVHCRFPIDMATVVPLTTRDRGLDHHVRIDSAESGLNRPSWARTEEITTISTQRFTRSQTSRHHLSRRNCQTHRVVVRNGRLHLMSRLLREQPPGFNLVPGPLICVINCIDEGRAERI